MSETAPLWPRSLALVGAGRMGGALLRGWLAHGLSPRAVHVVDPHLDAETSAFCIAEDVALKVPKRPPETLLLAVKPQVFAASAAAIAALAGPDTLVVSILAGKTIANLRASLPEAGAIVRAMPNLPASVGAGATGVAAEPDLSADHRAVAQTLLAAVGLVEWLDESLLDAVTAVSGSGPAYVFFLTECLAAAGIEAGLPAEVASRLARATVEGAGALLAAQPEVSPQALREAVTSKGGTTAAALEVLMGDGGIASPLHRAVNAAKSRAGKLAE